MTRRANRKKRLTVHYIVEHPNQEGDTCIDWTSQYCWTNGWNCLWRGHSVYRNRPLIPPPPVWWAVHSLFAVLPFVVAAPLSSAATQPPSDDLGDEHVPESDEGYTDEEQH